MRSMLFVFFAVALVATTGCKDKPAKEKPVTTPQANAGEPAKAKAKEVPNSKLPVYMAARIYNDYRENQVAAKQRYDSKEMLINVCVDRVKAKGKGAMVIGETVRLDAPILDLGAHFLFDDQTQVAKFKKGDYVVIRGTCNGYLLGVVNFGHCKYVREGAYTLDELNAMKF